MAALAIRTTDSRGKLGRALQATFPAHGATILRPAPPGRISGGMNDPVEPLRRTGKEPQWTHGEPSLSARSWQTVCLVAKAWGSSALGACKR